MTSNLDCRGLPKSGFAALRKLTCLGLVAVSVSVSAQTTPAQNTAASAIAGTSMPANLGLMQYDKPDRAEKILEAATKEGTLTLYTAFRPQDLPLIIAPFEAKYGIKVKSWRSGSNNVTQRVIREAAGKRPEVDVIMMPASEMEAVYREKLLQAVTSPLTKDLIPIASPSHKNWTTVFMNVTVHSYNRFFLY